MLALFPLSGESINKTSSVGSIGFSYLKLRKNVIPVFFARRLRLTSLITGYCCPVVSYKASQALRPFSDLLCVPHQSSKHSWFIHQSALANTSRDTDQQSREKLGEKCPLILPAKYLYHTPRGSLTCRKILRYGAESFTSPLKEVVRSIFITLKIHCPQPDFNPEPWVQW
jgi:hypothetical protein